MSISVVHVIGLKLCGFLFTLYLSIITTYYVENTSHFFTEAFGREPYHNSRDQNLIRKKNTERYQADSISADGEVVLNYESNSKDEVGHVFIPFQIDNPSFPYGEHENEALPLSVALSNMRRALKKLKNIEDINENGGILKNNIYKLADGSNVLRIEQDIVDTTAVSHNLDPLRWLRMQYDTLVEDRGEACVYFADAEGKAEAAVIGSMHTLTGPGSLNNEEWRIIQGIPPSMRYYGGSRFDPSYPEHKRSPDWKAYGGHYFVLPTLELRKEIKNNDRSVRDDKDISYTDGFQSRNEYSITLSINLRYGSNSKFQTLFGARKYVLSIIEACVEHMYPPIAPVLPCVVKEINTSQDDWENSVNAALHEIRHCDARSEKNLVKESHKSVEKNDKFEKVVLARSVDVYLGDVFHPLDPVLRYKFSGHYSHFLLLKPENKEEQDAPVFFSFTPERLFNIDSKRVETEALAGTRPRGSDAKADADLLQELISSPKDLAENDITINYIQSKFELVRSRGLVSFNSNNSLKGDRFVRRLRNLQHLCQNFSVQMAEKAKIMAVARTLMEELHPTPAMCGLPLEVSRDFIRNHESFDRGFYAGPFGYLGAERCEMVVSIRSALISHTSLNERYVLFLN